MTHMNWQTFRKEHPEFITTEGRREYKLQYKIDLPLFFDSYSFEELDFFRKDRSGNPRGLVKLWLHDILSYD